VETEQVEPIKQVDLSHDYGFETNDLTAISDQLKDVEVQSSDCYLAKRIKLSASSKKRKLTDPDDRRISP